MLLDDVTLPESDWSRAPRYVSIALLNACDLRCAFCYAPKTPRMLRVEDVCGWASELDANGCLGLGFGGGEPTLYPGFAALCRRAYEATDLAITFTTHGHHFTPDLAGDLAGYVSLARLSMDGVGETYERIRGRSFKAFLKAVEIVRSCAPFGINYVVNDETIADLEAAAELAATNGAIELLFLPELAADGRMVASESTLEALASWIVENYRGLRIAVSEQFASCADLPFLPINDGDSTNDFLHIDASGMLKCCAFTAEGILVSKYANLMQAVDVLRSSPVPSII